MCVNKSQPTCTSTNLSLTMLIHIYDWTTHSAIVSTCGDSSLVVVFGVQLEDVVHERKGGAGGKGERWREWE